MHRIFVAAVALILVVAMGVCVYAASDVSSMTSFATVESNGRCQISQTITLHLENPVEKLYFPIPLDATGVTLNGARVSASKSGDVRQVNLSRLVRNVVGDLTFNLQYSLYNVVSADETGMLEMQLPLLSGFEYPVQKMEFSVTMPGQVENLPGFVSGYHQARIEESLSYSVNGNVIAGSTVQALKDHETLTMNMQVTQQMFPRSLARTSDAGWGVTGMQICAAIALLVWLVGMWNMPVLPKAQTEPPQGYHAGQLGCIFAGKGLDLTMTVLSWAELGYVLIHVKGDRVFLYRRMDMGNERSDTERYYFKKIFAKRDRVDTADLRYAQLCKAAAKTASGTKEHFRRFNADPRIFRAIASGIGVFGGISIAIAIADGAVLQGLLLVIFGILGAISGWLIQRFGAGLFLRDRRELTIGLFVSALWVLLGILAGTPDIALSMVVMLAVAGILLAWGGRRTPIGKQDQLQVFGFAWYLGRKKKPEIARICKNDPDYFFRLAPYALALGLEKEFAKGFGLMRLEPCHYLTTGIDGQMTATQWSALMRRAVNQMNDRANRMWLERFIGIIESIIRR